MASETSEQTALIFDLINARRHHSPVRYTATWIVALLLSDLAMFVLAAYLAGSLVSHQWDIHNAAARLEHSSIVFIAVWMGMFYALGLYRRSLALSFKDEFYFTVIALIFGVVPQLIAFTLLPPSPSRPVLCVAAVIAIILVGTSRAIIHLARVATERRSPSRITVAGGAIEVSAVSDAAGKVVPRPRICNPTARLVKRIVDMAITSLALPMCLPVMLIAGLLVLLESGKPIFFRQERVGRFGRVFNIIKFRTMKADADSTWARPGDVRITRTGAFLRRTSIDELPQLFNVLLGDMSLVGPRPEMCSFEETFASRIPLYAERRMALPGITGWAQVNIKRNLSPDDVEEVLNYDLFYIEHWSVFLDFTVLLKTAAEFLFHRAV